LGAAGSEGEEVLAEAEEGQGKFYACNLQINTLNTHCCPGHPSRASRNSVSRIDQPKDVRDVQWLCRLSLIPATDSAHYMEFPLDKLLKEKNRH